MNEKSNWKKAQGFINGGVAGMVATSIIQPIDMVKVRIQLVGEQSLPSVSAAPSISITKPTRNPIKIFTGIIKNESVFGLYKGLSAGLLRQATYTTARMGLFNVFISVSVSSSLLLLLMSRI